MTSAQSGQREAGGDYAAPPATNKEPRAARSPAPQRHNAQGGKAADRNDGSKAAPSFRGFPPPATPVVGGADLPGFGFGYCEHSARMREGRDGGKRAVSRAIHSQEDKGRMAKAYQVKQLLLAIDRLGTAGEEG